MTGWFKLWRYLFTKPIWTDSTPEQKTILITLMGMVNYESSRWVWRGEGFDLVPGQVITSINKIKEKAGKGVTDQNVKTSIAKFKNLEFLTNESTNAGRLITIINWEIYQGDDPDTNKVVNRWLTDRSPTVGKKLTNPLVVTRVKEKKERSKEVKKEYYGEFVTLTDEEYKKLESKFGIVKTKQMIDILDNAKGAKGYKYKSDYRAILSWVVGKVQKEYVASAQILDEVEKDTRTPEEQKAGMEKFRKFASGLKLKGVD